MGVWQLQVEFQEDAHVHFTNFVAAMAFVFVAFAIDPTARCKPCPVLDGKQCGPPINNIFAFADVTPSSPKTPLIDWTQGLNSTVVASTIHHPTSSRRHCCRQISTSTLR
ncbi:hypothetical protein HBI70_056270 [Parastagonospora nodorum]|nr:hypothetical protein HBH75_077400 [Parastagonospora nodorum]KAH4987351.1 hypothetical protein HBI76_097100 [Parastagonospora nodorum]KAH5042042.1 hypothetical protein HBI75_039680 [Parastagonospora nodorum]KAH5060265.1 hypothetical protein HBH96_081500 [Parastagonospora nodorum]KAH5284308.1 hypothetical protein HBI70_056270 [Parastagonospora nodorum]